MKRAALMLTASLAVGTALGGLAYGDPLDDAVPAVPGVPAVPALPDAGGLVATVQETLAGVGLPLETPALPALPDATTALSTVRQTLADAGVTLPAQDPVLAVPENIIVGNGNEAVERLPLYLSAVPGVAELATLAEETVADLGLPLDEPAVPALPDPTSLLTTVQETVAGLGLPLGSLLPDL